MLNSTEHEISTAHKYLMLKINTFHAFKLSDVVFIMIIIVWHFNIYKYDKLLAQLNQASKKFYNLMARAPDKQVTRGTVFEPVHENCGLIALTKLCKCVVLSELSQFKHAICRVCELDLECM